MFPSFTIDASAGVNSSALSSLFESGSVFWGVGGNLLAPLFRGGELWYQRKAAIEALHQSRANYRQTVLAALQEVADALRALQHDAEAVAAQAEALAAAGDALALIKINFDSGLVDYLQVLIADVQYREAKLGHVRARTLRLQDTVALFVALGGGWPPTRKAR
jgi:outer membrane protein TolC